MKNSLFLFFLFQFSFNICNSQPIVAEGFVGANNYKYQHMLLRYFSAETRFGYFNSSSLQVFNRGKRSSEAMTQSYIIYKLSSFFNLGAGTFYATGAGFRPSVTLQFAHKTNDFFYVFSPRVDYNRQVAGELMILIEYRPSIAGSVHLYTRLNAMSNYGRSHNRSFQNLVVGVDWKNTQFGIGIMFDEWGKTFEVERNWGFLLKKELF